MNFIVFSILLEAFPIVGFGKRHFLLHIHISICLRARAWIFPPRGDAKTIINRGCPKKNKGRKVAGSKRASANASDSQRSRDNSRVKCLDTFLSITFLHLWNISFCWKKVQNKFELSSSGS